MCTGTVFHRGHQGRSGYLGGGESGHPEGGGDERHLGFQEHLHIMRRAGVDRVDPGAGHLLGEVCLRSKEGEATVTGIKTSNDATAPSGLSHGTTSDRTERLEMVKRQTAYE